MSLLQEIDRDIKYLKEKEYLDANSLKILRGLEKLKDNHMKALYLNNIIENLSEKGKIKERVKDTDKVALIYSIRKQKDNDSPIEELTKDKNSLNNLLDLASRMVCRDRLKRK